MSAFRKFLLSLVVVLLSGPLFAQPFTHPGCLSTQADLDRMRAKVAANAQPWKASWDILVANSHAQLSYAPNPQAVICRGGACASMGYSENYMIMANDAHAAYQCALRYLSSGDTNYASKAVQIMDAWSGTLTNITGDSNWLLAGGIQGYQWACAAELMRSHTGWAATNFARFQNMLLTEFYPGISDFLQRHNGTCDTHYWANWDLCAMTSLLSIGVVCDRRDIYNEGIDYYLTGIGNGAADKLVFFTHPGYMGQWQEAGRDQGHCTLGPALMGPFCEIAWNQGDDMYGYASNLFLAGCEYVAKYNAQPLTDTVPYVTYANCDNVVQPWISSSGRGAARPGWDLVYNHFVNRRGLAAPYTALIAAQVRPEGGGGNYGSTSGGYDQLGFTTLTHSLDPIATNAVAAPSCLKAEVLNNAVTLSWWGSAYASSYTVKRATTSGGPYSTIASGVRTNLCYTDVGLLAGTNYLYVVSAIVGGLEATNSPPVSATANLRLTGTIIGSTGSYNNLGATKETVFDGALGNYYDAANTSGDWAGLDLGKSNVITRVAYAPRIAIPSRMVGGQFQGANVADFSSGVVTLFTVPSSPPTQVLTYQTISNPNAFRYVRYLGPANGSCNVAEIQFFGSPNPTGAPAAPLNVSATAGNAQATLTWSVSTATTSFNVKRGTGSGGPYASVASGVKTTTYLDLGLTNLTTYYYVVSAVNATGEGSNSVEVVATPSALLLNKGGSGMASDWTGTSPSAAEGPGKAFDGTTSTKWYNGTTMFPGWLQYNFGVANKQTVVRYDVSSANDVPARDPSAWLFQASDNGSTWTTLDTRTGQTFSARYQTHTHWITNATAYQYYRLYITTNYYMFTNNSVTSTYGVQISELALMAYGPAPPTAPTGVTATPGNAQNALSWSASSGASSYNVKRSTISGGPYTFNLIATPTTTSFVDTNVANGTTYYYVVAAVSANGEGGNSTEVSAMPQLPLPAAPASLTASAGDAQAVLVWSSVSNATGYNVKRSTTNGGPYTVPSSTSLTSCTNSGLMNGTLYYFVVTATNALGESTNSMQTSVRPVSMAAANIASLLINRQLQLAWPQDHTGWRLESQTNTLVLGLGTNWMTVSGSADTNQFFIPIELTNGSVFFRLVYP